MQTLGNGGRMVEIGKCMTEKIGDDNRGANFLKTKKNLIKELVLLCFPMSNTSLVFIKMVYF